MVDTDTFLTVLYVMADDFCKCRSQPQRTPGPKASLTRSEVVTLVIFSQWARFRSERDFYRYAASRLRPAFPTLPRRSQFNRLTRRHYGIRRLSPATWWTCCKDRVASMKPWTVPVFPPGLPNAGAPVGWPGRLTLAGATAWAGMKASTCCLRSIPRGSSPASALPQPASRTRPWPGISSPSGIPPIPGGPLWGSQPGAGTWWTKALRARRRDSGGETATEPG